MNSVNSNTALIKVSFLSVVNDLNLMLEWYIFVPCYFFESYHLWVLIQEVNTHLHQLSPQHGNSFPDCLPLASWVVVFDQISSGLGHSLSINLDQWTITIFSKHHRLNVTYGEMRIILSQVCDLQVGSLLFICGLPWPLVCLYTTKPEIIGRRSPRLKTFVGIDSTCVSVLSGTIRPIISGFVVMLTFVCVSG